MLRFYTPQAKFERILPFISLDAVRKLNNVPSLTVTIPHDLRLDRFIGASVTFDWTLQKSVCVVGGSGYGANRNVVTIEDSNLVGASIFGYSEIFTDVDSTDTDTLTEGALTMLSKQKTRPTLTGQYNGSVRFGQVVNLPPLTTGYQNDSLAVLEYENWQAELWRLKRVVLEESEAVLEFRGLNSLLEDRIVLESGPLTGSADNLIKSIVREAMTTGERAVPLLEVAPDLNSAPVVTIEDIRFRPVIDVLADIADVSRQKGTALYYSIRSDASFGLRFETSAVPLVSEGGRGIIDIDKLSISGSSIEIEPEWALLV